jgi:hypothetical protein
MRAILQCAIRPDFAQLFSKLLRGSCGEAHKILVTSMVLPYEPSRGRRPLWWEGLFTRRVSLLLSVAVTAGVMRCSVDMVPIGTANEVPRFLTIALCRDPGCGNFAALPWFDEHGLANRSHPAPATVGHSPKQTVPWNDHSRRVSARRKAKAASDTIRVPAGLRRQDQLAI